MLLFRKLGQYLFGLTDRRSAARLARKDTLAVFYRGEYVVVELPWGKNSTKDLRQLGEILRALRLK